MRSFTLGLSRLRTHDVCWPASLKAFWMPTEYIAIIGLGIGAMVIMAPFQVIKKVIGSALATLKGIPYSKKVYRFIHGNVKCSCWDEKMV